MNRLQRKNLASTKFILFAIVLIVFGSAWIYQSFFNSNELLADLREEAAKSHILRNAGEVIAKHVPVGMSAEVAQSLMNSNGFIAEESAYISGHLSLHAPSQEYLGFRRKEYYFWPIITLEFYVVFGLSEGLIDSASASIIVRAFGV